MSSTSNCKVLLLSMVVIFCGTALQTTYAQDSIENLPAFANDENLRTCNRTAMDHIIRWLFFFNDPTRVLPRDTTEVDEFCDEKSRSELYVNAYARRCLAKFPKQVTSLLMFGIARKNRYYCNFPKGRAEILAGARCLNAIKKTGGQCLRTAINDMKAIRFASKEGKIAKTCCTYYRLEECLVHKTQEDHTACTAKDAKRMEELLDGYTSQMINYVCAKYQKDIDHCAKVLPKRELSKLRKLASKSEDSQEEALSILQPMIDILDSIPP